MLYIKFLADDKTILNSDSYFNYSYDPEWFSDELVKRMVLDVDKSVVEGPYCVMSPVFGQIPPRMLSGGVKALILALKVPGIDIYATSCGDNCAKWFLEIGKKKDIFITLEHLMDFGVDFEAICVNDGRKINSLSDYFDAYFEFTR